jgi:hypothetical protein
MTDSTQPAVPGALERTPYRRVSRTPFPNERTSPIAATKPRTNEAATKSIMSYRRKLGRPQRPVVSAAARYRSRRSK